MNGNENEVNTIEGTRKRMFLLQLNISWNRPVLNPANITQHFRVRYV